MSASNANIVIIWIVGESENVATIKFKDGFIRMG